MSIPSKKNILRSVLKETSWKAYFFTLLLSILSGIFIYLTADYSMYFLFGSILFSLFAALLFFILTRGIIVDYKKKLKSEENLPNGVHNRYFDNSEIVKEIFNIHNGKRIGNYKLFLDNGQLAKECNYKNGKYDGDYFEYYSSGVLKLKLTYKMGIQNDKSYLYSRNGKLVREAEFLNGNYFNRVLEYYENGIIRMSVNVSDGSHVFYSENGVKLCEITINKRSIEIDEFREDNSIWCAWIWKRNVRVKFQPYGVWRNYSEDGLVDYELDFSSNFYNEDNPNYVFKRCYDSDNNLLSKQYILLSKLNIETFYNDFAFERLVDKHARYAIAHFNPGGWRYADFDINPINELEDLLVSVIDDSPQN